jgi:D-tyrosyl-tRNA(Tyr) deacylase
MNLSLLETGGEMLVVSQFTLYGDARRGRRPSYTEAAEPDKAKALYECFVIRVRDIGIRVQTGVFQAMMKVKLVNDGPVTILLDSEKQF